MVPHVLLGSRDKKIVIGVWLLLLSHDPLNQLLERDGVGNQEIHIAHVRNFSATSNGGIEDLDVCNLPVVCNDWVFIRRKLLRSQQVV